MQETSIEQLQADRAQIIREMKNPYAGEEARRQMGFALAEIERRLSTLGKSEAPAQESPRPAQNPERPNVAPPPPQKEGGRAWDKFRDPAEQQEYEAPKTAPFAPQSTQGPTAPQPHAEAEVETAATTQSETHVYTALVSDNRTVVIMWEGEEAKTYRLDALPGLFRSRLAELAASKDAERQLWHLLPTTRTFYRAVGFLKAIAEAWRRMPTANELDVDGRNETRMTIFNLIAEAVEKETK